MRRVQRNTPFANFGAAVPEISPVLWKIAKVVYDE
jgi:hypothetical protein